eukprot:g72521.t1
MAKVYRRSKKTGRKMTTYRRKNKTCSKVVRLHPRYKKYRRCVKHIRPSVGLAAMDCTAARIAKPALVARCPQCKKMTFFICPGGRCIAGKCFDCGRDSRRHTCLSRCMNGCILFVHDIRYCQCKAKAKLLQAKKDGPNKDRWFYVCQFRPGCDFFEWADEKKFS